MKTLCVVLLAVLPAEAIRLDSNAVTIEIDSASGALTAVENRLTGGVKSIRDVPFRITTSAGEFTPQDCRPAGQDGGAARFDYRCGPLEVQLAYTLTRSSAAARKDLRITNRGQSPVTIFEISMVNWVVPDRYPPGYSHSYYSEGINQIYFHRSGLWYDHSICLFLRDERGGLFLGVENPFFEARHNALRKVYPATVELSYRPRWILQPGHTFEGDTAFIGAYRQEGVYALPPGGGEHFGGRERLPFRVLDWGEVWAMQAYMREIMPLPATTRPAYPMAYWSLADPSVYGKISRKKDRGETVDAEEEAMWKHFGGRSVPFDDQELWFRLTPETLRFYKKAVDDAAWLGGFQTFVVPNMLAGNAGWFASPGEKSHGSGVSIDQWFSSPSYPLWSELAAYAGQRGMRMFTLELAGRSYRSDRPDWKYMDRDGQRRKANCYANAEYADWYTARVDEALLRHPIGQWQWDEGWMDVLTGMIGENAACYDRGHGHPAGEISYQQFRQVERTLRILRKNHPDVRFVIISGLIRGMPWLMRSLDSDSHTGAMEHGAWADHNLYFLPPSRSHRQGGVHWILENRSAGEEPRSKATWYRMLEDPKLKEAYRARWRKWTEWAGRNQQILEIHRDLFRSAPSRKGLEGSAHALGPRGLLFVHNPTRATRVGEVQLDGKLGIEERPRFRLRRLHPDEADAGVYAWKDLLRVPVPAEATLLFEIEPTERPVSRILPSPRSAAPAEKAFLNLDDIRSLVSFGDLWPATGLKGTKEMPVF